MSQLIAYVDGFNLYYGLRERWGRRYLWLDLVAAKYFTASVLPANKNGPPKRAVGPRSPERGVVCDQAITSDDQCANQLFGHAKRRSYLAVFFRHPPAV